MDALYLINLSAEAERLIERLSVAQYAADSEKVRRSVGIRERAQRRKKRRLAALRQAVRREMAND